ncbi:uncharacterized protein BX663DRAFT_520339 [Cokeromyces recurvatus]|uniref:uncharacterized protein n=1 Tax=Cokeromyces recurvatus TaxID=90255 RepID=UPI0022211EDE|nr:uncharacterized protein BX663DRAFT_520339 [Cokeromyces recurvatus]KAI7899759.1 hypothetical protein BX663DRAFT_520339 [Cokeromyces recurvatus]
MARPYPQDKQNNIKPLLELRYSYSEIMKSIPGIKKSTICDYKCYDYSHLYN